jgi:ferredoxin-NADP reductase/MOSC domain-containing protein YiiM
MKVISVNVGSPREIEWRGQMVRTSIFKTPVNGRVNVRKLNIDGDSQSDLISHGGEHRAVMVYQAESYQYWREHFRRKDWVYGQFGENLTITGLADTDVCIGDRFKIGTVIFEVTQPRVTCHKVGISTGVPEMPAMLVAHKRPGFYFRVIQEGQLGAGDTITKVAEGRERMSITDIDLLLYSNVHSKQGLQQALKIPALSKGWKTSFQELLNAQLEGIANGNAGLTGQQGRPAAWTGFRPFVVQKSRMESFGIRSFELKYEGLDILPEFLAGQHVALHIPDTTNHLPLTRMYSLCGPPGAETYRIAVKREVDGVGSAYLHDQIKDGDVLEISAPRGAFTLTADQNPIALLSAGIGITPLLGMLHSILQNNSTREVWWIHSTQNGRHHSFAREVKSISACMPAFHSVVIYSHPADDELPGLHYDFRGHLNRDLLEALRLPTESEYYICGPAGYLSDTLTALQNLGVPEGKIRTEAFNNNNTALVPGSGIVPHPPPDNSGTGPIVTFAKSNISFQWQSRFSSLLEAAEACDVPVQWSCRSGVCHRCESALLDGRINYELSPLDFPAEGNVLICCAIPVSPVELDP